MLSDKVYNVLKVIAQYVLPATASLYFGLAKIWNLPYSEQVVGTIMAVDVFLGAILGISVSAYNKKMAATKYVQSSIPELVVAAPEQRNIFSMTNSTYDILYWTGQIALPAIGTLYFAMAGIWQLPYGEQVAGTIALVDAFLGIFLGISTNQYNKLKEEVPA